MASVVAGSPVSRAARTAIGRTKGAWGRTDVKVVAWLASLLIATSTVWLVLQPANHSSESPQATSTASGPGFRSLVDTHAGYQLSYPANWTGVDVSRTQGGDDHLIRINGDSALSVRSFQLARAVNPRNLADMRAVTDAILSDPAAKLTVLEVRQVVVGTLPAIYYLYYFPIGHQRGLHAHYFVFNGTQMYSLVFQVVPDTQFGAYAPMFDRVIASFKPMPH